MLDFVNLFQEGLAKGLNLKILNRPSPQKLIIIIILIDLRHFISLKLAVTL
jgi:hypothetical protein